MGDRETLAETAFALEYDKLKDEQIDRINTRDNLIYAAMAAVAAAIAFALGDGNSKFPLLAVAPASFALGWTYLANDLKISQIGDYIKETSERVFGKGAMGWESTHRTDARRGRHKQLQLVVDLLTFSVSGLATVAAYFVLETSIPWFAYPFGAAGVLLSLLLAYETVSASPIVPTR